jgi:S-DNA-T family DNA segregation ATPase FtsK/SpoIIIE
MARATNQKKPLKQSIKFEIYGIILIVISTITIAHLGHVGRFMISICRFIIGNWDFIIPLIGIQFAVATMIKRSWPKWFTIRKIGVLFLILGLMLMEHMSWFHTLFPNGDMTGRQIISETWDSLKSAVISNSLIELESGGGILGALLYSLLFYFFDNLGVRIIHIAFFAVGIILITGISYVEIGHLLKGRFDLILKKMKNTYATNKQKKENSSAKSKKSENSLTQVDPLDTTSISDSSKFIDLAKNIKTNVPGRPDEVMVDPHLQSSHDEIQVHVPIIKDFQQTLRQEKSQNQINNHFSSPTDTNGSLSEAIPYQLPSFDLLGKPSSAKNAESADYKANARKLESLLASFGVKAKVLEIVRGPAVTRYEIQPDIGVKVSKIVSLTDDIALSLAAKDIRMEAPIPGKAAIGIEVPNPEISIVTMREVMETPAFQNASSHLSIALGRDISGQAIVGNLIKMPHLLVAGATGSGKSVCINGIIASILYKATPKQVKFLMIDPKMVELNVYNGIPHLLAPVVTDPKRASLALKKVVVEMEKRYELFAKTGVRNIEGYNANMTEQELLPYIVVIVDELADLMIVAAGDVEDAISRLAQMARAAGIHLIIATQRPSVDVITGVIKANIPSRIAFGVSSQVDSRTILDSAGAEKLLGRGDMLYLPAGSSKAQRIQGAFLSDSEVEKIVQFVSHQEKANYVDDIVPMVDEQNDENDYNEDELFDQAVRIILEAKQASVSLLQRRMRIGYTRAARLIDAMEAKGIIGPYEGSKPRDVRMTLDQYTRLRVQNQT